MADQSHNETNQERDGEIRRKLKWGRSNCSAVRINILWLKFTSIKIILCANSKGNRYFLYAINFSCILNLVVSWIPNHGCLCLQLDRDRRRSILVLLLLIFTILFHSSCFPPLFISASLFGQDEQQGSPSRLQFLDHSVAATKKAHSSFTKATMSWDIPGSAVSFRKNWRGRFEFRKLLENHGTPFVLGAS